MLKELGLMFGSVEKVKLLRFFLANQYQEISFADLSEKAKVKPRDLKSELKTLLTAGFVNEVIIHKEETTKLKSGKVKIKKTKEKGYSLNIEYPLIDSLSKLVLDFRFVSRLDLLEKFKKFGKIKVFCVGGIFIQDKEPVLDILIAGDSIEKEKIDQLMQKLEADFGTEIKYAVFESEEFVYRVNMFDRLLKDFWKRPHEKVLEKIPTRP